MIETLLVFAAGFLTASLLALVILPSINTRAERLARLKLAAQFPISIEELTAQMDYLRAENAIEIRKIERQLDQERKAHALHRAQLGRLESEKRQLDIMLDAIPEDIKKSALADLSMQTTACSPGEAKNENALLRERIEEVADKIISLTQPVEKSTPNQTPTARSDKPVSDS